MLTKDQYYDSKIVQIEPMIKTANDASRLEGLKELNKAITTFYESVMPYSNEGAVLAILVTCRNEFANSLYDNLYQQSKETE